MKTKYPPCQVPLYINFISKLLDRVVHIISPIYLPSFLLNCPQSRFCNIPILNQLFLIINVLMSLSPQLFKLILI